MWASADSEQDVWAEAHTEQGERYYYHVVTGETAWERHCVSLEPKSGVEHSGNNSGGEPPWSETVDRCLRMCKRVFVLPAEASPIFAPQLSCKSSL